MKTENPELKKQIILRFIMAPIFMGLMLFLLAGSLDYWQAWICCGVLLIPAYLFTPFVLGSYFELPFFLPLIPPLVSRLLNEEDVLLRELPGYKEYCQKTRYHLIPFIY